MQRSPIALDALALLLLLAVGCGSDGPDDELGQQRAEQAREAARHAGLPDDVGDFLALLGSSPTATYQVTYPATAGVGSVVISQSPPNRRVDVTDGKDIAESSIIRGGTTYKCVPRKKGSTELRCTRSGGGSDLGGPFRPEALSATTDALLAAADDYDIEVTKRRIASVPVTCLVATAKPGRADPATTLDGTLCLSAEGVVLAVERGDQRVEATGYTRDVPDGTFDLPDRG